MATDATATAPGAALAGQGTMSSPTFFDGTSRAWRWWGAAAGVVLSILDTAGLSWLGVELALNGRNVTVLVALYFATSFALLGYLIGWVAEARIRDRHAAALIRSQTEAIANARLRLAQSEKLAALGQLAAAIAHEVRSPLAVIRSATQGLCESLPAADPEASRAASFITAEIDRLGNVIQSLLEFARPLQLSPVAVAAHDLVERVMLLVGDDAAAKRIHLRRNERAADAMVEADPDLICQVLLGFVSNAADAMPDGGEILLTTHAENGTIELAVADSGPGIPPELRERIFEPFFTTRARGVGLGLAVARQIASAHGGRIDVGASDRGGARFALRLPAAGRRALAA